MATPVIALLTDFGLKDHYVAVMKARMLADCPNVRFIDITHQVSPQSIEQGAFSLEQAVPWFPPGTVFLCVVDPGVGSERKAVAVRAGDFFFVAPDNGLLGRALDGLGGPDKIVQLGTPPDASTTFHGRDIFAPAAARLAAGVAIESLGKPIDKLLQRSTTTTVFKSDELKVTVLTLDHFGNVIFDFKRATGWEPLQVGNFFQVKAPRKTTDVPFCATYSRVLKDDFLLLWNASNYLELAQRDGNAAGAWRLSPGDTVNLLFKQE